jgi:hypothetical protein
MFFFCVFPIKIYSFDDLTLLFHLKMDWMLGIILVHAASLFLTKNLPILFASNFDPQVMYNNL